MSVRPLILLGLAGLLGACSSEAPKAPQAPATQQQSKKAASPQVELGPLPAFQRELSASLIGVPAGAEAELALLVIDNRGRPQQLLASSKLNGTGQALPMRLRFNPEAFPAGARVELRGRASQSGQLILHLPAVAITQPTTQTLGPLQFEKAP